MRRSITLAATALLGATLVRAAADFEVPPDESPSASLTPSQVAGENFHVQDPVHSDGLMPHYVVVSRFGIFPAYGRDALVARLREVAALTTISKTSSANEVLSSVERGIQQDAKDALRVATNPIGTVLGIPRGIKHLLSGYRAQAEEASAQTKQTINGNPNAPNGQSQGNVGTRAAAQTKSAAERYADRYLGLSAAERHWYARLGVDPYTDNVVLHRAVKRLAKIDAATGLAMRFAPVGIPFAGEVHVALDAIYNEDPAVLRKRRREALAAYGLTPAEVQQFENTLLLSPTRQTILVNAVEALNGVEGRTELLRHAMSVTSEEEVEVFLQSTSLLVRFHASHPLKAIVAGVRVPAARLPDSRLAVFGAFDAVYWTKDVAADEAIVRQALPHDVTGRDLWLSGSVSPLARTMLTKNGTDVHDHAEEALGTAQPPRKVPAPAQSH